MLIHVDVCGYRPLVEVLICFGSLGGEIFLGALGRWIFVFLFLEVESACLNMPFSLMVWIVTIRSRFRSISSTWGSLRSPFCAGIGCLSAKDSNRRR